MIAFLKRISNDLFTEANGVVVDLKRVAAGSGILGFHFLSIQAVCFNHEKFDPSAYGLGLGALIAAVGGSLALGAKAESDPEPPAK